MFTDKALAYQKARAEAQRLAEQKPREEKNEELAALGFYNLVDEGSAKKDEQSYQVTCAKEIVPSYWNYFGLFGKSASVPISVPIPRKPSPMQIPLATVVAQSVPNATASPHPQEDLFAGEDLKLSREEPDFESKHSNDLSDSMLTAREVIEATFHDHLTISILSPDLSQKLRTLRPYLYNDPKNIAYVAQYEEILAEYAKLRDTRLRELVLAQSEFVKRPACVSPVF